MFVGFNYCCPSFAWPSNAVITFIPAQDKIVHEMRPVMTPELKRPVETPPVLGRINVRYRAPYFPYMQ